MEKIYVFLMILGYFIFLFACYIFIVKRLKYITEKHIEYTKVEGLMQLYKQMVKVIFFLFIMLFVSSVFIILTFF